MTPEPHKRRRSIVETATYVVAAYVIALAGINVHEIVPWTSHIFPVFGQSLDRTSVDAAWRDVESQYVVRSVDDNVASAGAEQGIITALQEKYGDRFSAYLTAAEEQALNAELSGQRGGSIGVSLEPECHGAVCGSGQTADAAIIAAVLVGQPADKAGIRPGDQLISVNGKHLTAMAAAVVDQVDIAASLIRGQAGTDVHLVVARAGVQVPITVTRENLVIPSVYTRRFGSTLYMQVTGFDTNTGAEAVAQLKQGLAAGATSIIIDLRDNGGGYVTAAQTLASQFVAPIPGKQEDVVVRRGRLDANQDPGSAEKVVHDTINGGGVALTPKLAILVNGNTASAAEIVTACLHDYHRATVVGVQTFGKGSVQEDFPLPDGSDLHLTVEKWYGPDGESIDLHGITPDLVVPLGNPAEQFSLDAVGGNPSVDPQLQAALKVVGPQ